MTHDTALASLFSFPFFFVCTSRRIDTSLTQRPKFSPVFCALFKTGNIFCTADENSLTDSLRDD